MRVKAKLIWMPLMMEYQDSKVPLVHIVRNDMSREKKVKRHIRYGCLH